MNIRNLTSIFLILIIGWNFLFIPTNSIFIKHDLKKEYNAENYSQNTARYYEKKMGINNMMIYSFDIFVHKNLFYIGSSHDLDLFNIENPSKPKRIISYEYCTSLSGNNNFLFAIQSNYPLDMLSYFDLNVNASKIEYTNPIVYGCVKITVENNYLYALRNDLYNYDNSTITCIKVTKPNEVTIISNFTIDYVYFDFDIFNYNLLVKNNILYYLDRLGHLTIINYSDPFNPNLLIEYDNVPFTNLFLSDEYLFLLTNQYLTIYNNTNPFNMKKVASFNYNGLKSLFVKDNKIYLIDKETFFILDISNLPNLNLLDQYVRGKREHNYFEKIMLSNNLAFIMTEFYYTSGESGTQTGYYIFDISNPNRIKREYPVRFQFSLVVYFVFYFILFYLLPSFIAIEIITIIISLIIKKIRKKKGK